MAKGVNIALWLPGLDSNQPTIRLTVNEPPSAERKMAPRMGSAYGLKLKGVASIGFATPGRHVGEAVDRNSRTHKTMTSSRSARRARRRNT